jgi:lysophospholipase L1-like esterase
MFFKINLFSIIVILIFSTGCSIQPTINKDQDLKELNSPAPNTDQDQGPGSEADLNPAPNTGGTTPTPNTTYEDEAGIQYFGRWEIENSSKATASWGAVYLKARFEGTSLKINLNDSQNDFNYRIDGGQLQLLQPTSATQYTLATGLNDGEHTFELYRRSSGGWGQTVFNGLVLDPGKNLLPPPTRPTRKIEVIGDSISVGFGNEGGGGNSREQENGYMAYGPQLARKFNAEWSIIGHSGQGVYRNLYENLPPSQDNMTDEFLLTHFPAWSGMQNSSWDFSKWQPDALLVVLGTNDFSGNEVPTKYNFETAYSAFLSTIRARYPNTVIFAVGTFMYNWGVHSQFDNCNSYICNVVAQKNANGDGNIHCIDPGAGQSGNGHWLPNASDYINDWTHPTIPGHTIIADNLYQTIKPILGW